MAITLQRKRKEKKLLTLRHLRPSIYNMHKTTQDFSTITFFPNACPIWSRKERYHLSTFNRVYCNCNYILFTKLPWPGDSEGTFRSSSQAATCSPVYHTRRRLHTALYLLNVKQGSCEYQFLWSLV